MPDRRPFDVLLIEHEPDDIRVFEAALRAKPELPGVLHVVRDTTEAVDVLAGRGRFADAPAPNLVVFNSRLPNLLGSGLIQAVGRLRVRFPAPVIMICQAAGEAEIALAYRSYVSSYYVIPADPVRYQRMVRRILEYWLTGVVLPRPRRGTGAPLPD
jgi:DNA-binding NtrC family response regulator